MPYDERLALYKEIEQLRKRPLLVYVTSLRQNAAGAIAPDVISEFVKQLLVIPRDASEIDILIVSNGGDAIVPWRIVNILRERFARIGVLLPYVAYSAATLLALGADEIVMHPFSNLGPVDPQLFVQRQVPNPGGQGERTEQLSFGSEDARNFLEFVRKDVGISDQEQLEKAFELLSNAVGALSLGAARRSSELAQSLGEELLNLHMKDNNKAKTIAAALNRSYHSHSFTLGKKQALKIGLPVVEAPDERLEGLMWAVWTNMEAEMQCGKPFDPLHIVLESSEAGKLLSPISQLQMPANLPPAVLQALYQQVLQQISSTSVQPVDYEVFIATLESTRMRSEYKSRGKIFAVRQPDTTIALNIIKTFEQWNTL